MLLPQKVFRAAAIRAQKETLGMLFAFGPAGRPELMYGAFQSDLLHQPWPRLPRHHLSNFSPAFPANCIAPCRNLQTNREEEGGCLLTLADEYDKEEEEEEEGV